MKTKIFLQNNFIFDSTLSDNAFAAYAVLCAMIKHKRDKYYINHQLLNFGICGKLTLSRKYSERLLKGFQELIERKIIGACGNKGNSYIIDLSSIAISNDVTTNAPLFTVIYEEEIHRIMNNVANRVDKFALLRYFAVMINSISVNTEYNYTGHIIRNFVGFTSIAKLAELAGIKSPNTVLTYNNLLEDAKLIFVYHSLCIRDRVTGRYHTRVNNYGRYDDREYIKMYAESRERYLKYATEAEQHSERVAATNWSRKMTMFYRELCKGNSEKYTEDTIQDIYNHIFAHNEKVKKKMDCYKDDISKVQQIYADEWKDEAVFKQFAFLELKEHIK